MLVLPNKSAKVWTKFLKENKVLVYKYIFREIKKGIQHNEDLVNLFEFEGTDISAWIPKKNYLTTLQEALRVFVKAEEYEYAGKVTELINTYYIDQLLNDTTQE